MLKLVTVRPFTTFTDPLPIAVVPLKKETVPVGVPTTCGDTTAVNVTGKLPVAGLADELIAMVVVAARTTSVPDVSWMLAPGRDAAGV